MTKTTPRRPVRPESVPFGATTSNLTMAELSLQRAEFQHARSILEQRIANGAEDFKTLNLYAISLAHMKDFDTAATIFARLEEVYRQRQLRVKAAFNLGLVRFYQDLVRTGDQSVASFTSLSPGTPAPEWQSLPKQPFAAAIKAWETILQGRPPYEDIVLTFLSFAYLQSGDFSSALLYLRGALSKHENFFLTHFVLGRVFLDLYYLALEGNDFPLDRDVVEFFEIDDDEIVREEDGLFFIVQDTFLDIALQGFLEGRSMNPLSPEILVGLADAYMLAGLFEEANETLGQAESMAPESLATLEAMLHFHERVMSPPEAILSIVQRIKSLRKNAREDRAHFIMPPYYLT